MGETIMMSQKKNMIKSLLLSLTIFALLASGAITSLSAELVTVLGQKGYLGLSYNISPEAFSTSLDKFRTSARVQNLAPNGPAQLVGIKAGDYIYKVDGLLITTDEQLKEYITSLPPGATPKLTVLRLQVLEITPVLGSRPQQIEGSNSQPQFTPIPFK